jgi:hypothetical protein
MKRASLLNSKSRSREAVAIQIGEKAEAVVSSPSLLAIVGLNTQYYSITTDILRSNYGLTVALGGSEPYRVVRDLPLRLVSCR